MNATSDPLVTDYLREVERGLAPLPRGRRAEVLADLREHLDAALAQAATEADVRNALDRLGAPAEVAGAALDEAGVRRHGGGTGPEWWALALLGPGSLFVPVLGWLGGITMVWMSRVWSRGEKLLATLVFPFGWFGSLMFVSFSVPARADCTTAPAGQVGTCMGRVSGWLWAYAALAIVGPLVSIVVLLRGLLRYRRASAL
jgi:hypothetical protein